MTPARGVAAPLDIFLVAGEQSGDELGADLMRALVAACPGARLRGVGGPAMEARGLKSLFPMADIAVMGISPVIARLPTLLARIRATAAAVIADPPDVLVIIDSPSFTHRVARLVRARLPDLPVIDYVSPTIWAWRPGRARRMRAYVDHVLALLPFEPAAHRALGGPACSYAGHPLIEKLDTLRPSPDEARARREGAPTILVLPGSRRSEIERLLALFGETVALIAPDFPDADFVLPAVTHLEGDIRARVANWPVQPRIVTGEAAKYAAFRRARAALTASGTVTLELALSGVPTIIAYRASMIEEAMVRLLVKTPWAGLPNILLERMAAPEFLQRDCTAANMAPALAAILRDTPERTAQLAAFDEVLEKTRLPPGETASGRAAAIILRAARHEKGPPVGDP